MSHTPARYILVPLLMVLTALTYSGCIFIVVDYCYLTADGEYECDFEIADTVDGFFEVLYRVTYGDLTQESTRSSGQGAGCPSGLRCNAPFCKRVEVNGSFEWGEEANPIGWYGDQQDVGMPTCFGTWANRFIATTPNGPGTSPSAQMYQVIDLIDHLPSGLLPNWRRARANAAFTTDGTGDRRFGLHLSAYAGNPDAFPRGDDYEMILQNTSSYDRLAFTENFFQADDTLTTWEALLTEMTLPVNTSFLVVILEAYEDGQNQSVGTEFSTHLVDVVQVALDTGPSSPFASDDQAITLEDTPVDIFTLLNDVDPDGFLDPSSFTLPAPPDHGSVSISPSAVVTYTPDLNFFGTDTFSYFISDNDGNRSNEALVTIRVTPLSDPPVTADDTYQVQGGAPLVVDAPGVLANDVDPDGDTLTVVLTDDVDHGTLTLGADGAFTYTPDQGFLGDDRFMYRALDGTFTSDETTVDLLRLVVQNQPPTAEDDDAETGIGEPITIDVLANDTDPDGMLDPSTVTIASNPSRGGSVRVNADGTIEYTPPPDQAVRDTFRYTVRDEDGAISNEATVTVLVR